LWVITKPGLEKVWALRIKRGCVSVLTQPPLSICNTIIISCLFEIALIPSSYGTWKIHHFKPK
ncbi:hypothetical protein O1364_21240, partial [Bacteroides fragilis]|uniref:hypothetical protein n=1 Tax=Bacteroides fragilis TaxID=817 RepID=UPI0022AA20AC